MARSNDAMMNSRGQDTYQWMVGRLLFSGRGASPFPAAPHSLEMKDRPRTDSRPGLAMVRASGVRRKRVDSMSRAASDLESRSVYFCGTVHWTNSLG